MGKFSDWLERHGFSNPAKDLDRVVGCINRIAIDAERLEARPVSAAHMVEIEALQLEARKFRTALTGALALNPRYRAMTQSHAGSWRLHAARDVLTAAEVRLEKMRGRILAELAASDAVQAHETERNRKPANARWARLDDVKEWAFQQRRDAPEGDRAPVIRRILPEVKERARAAGEPLTGDDAAVTRTITDWFRKAGIS